jgi:hypothetical protein
MKGAAISRLVGISQLSQDYRRADEKLVDRRTVGLNRIIVDKMEPAAQVALREPFQESDLKSIIMTELERLGRLPHCDFKRRRRDLHCVRHRLPTRSETATQ